MGTRKYKKDHLKDYAGVEAVAQSPILPPEPSDPLIFWTGHLTENYRVDLRGFADGVFERPTGAPKTWTGYSGRSQLIHQLVPVVKNTLLGATRLTAKSYVQCLRAWWRVFDLVEGAIDQLSQPLDRVDDVRKLTNIHSEFAHRIGMSGHAFSDFRFVANLTLRALGEQPLFWPTPEDPEPQRHLPPEEQTKALRISLKQAWERVQNRWDRMEKLAELDDMPEEPEDKKNFKYLKYLASTQKTYNCLLPTSDQFRDGLSQKTFTQDTGISLTELRATRFPTRWDVDTAFHLCLAATGWNVATLLALDANKGFLRSHPKDPERFILEEQVYELVGSKARARGKAQLVFGLWKTRFGPGYIIKTWLERVAPLRVVLAERLRDERRHYAEMIQQGVSEEERTAQFKRLQSLEYGCRSVWLYVDRAGEVKWLEDIGYGHVYQGERATFLTKQIGELNTMRAAKNQLPIPPITVRDFRLIFGVFVWRQSGGNILALQRALSHARESTTSRYADNNILNSECDLKSLNFMNHFFAELGSGRVDATILACLNKNETLSSEMEQRLAQYRQLSRSRIGVACKDPRKPPSYIQENRGKERLCGPQRCLLCREHAVILPESLDGVAMRVEELLCLQEKMPVEAWLSAAFPDELHNGLFILTQYPASEVVLARQAWRDSIFAGTHVVPGYKLLTPSQEDM